jgi:hypothetical protein
MTANNPRKGINPPTDPAITPERGGDGRCSRGNGERPPFADAVWADDPSFCQWCAGTGHLYGDLEGDICFCPDLTPNPTPRTR